MYIIITFHILDIGVNLGKHGEPKTSSYDVTISIFATIVMMVLYYYAGLFR